MKRRFLKRASSKARGFLNRGDIWVEEEFVRGKNVSIGENTSIAARNLYLGDGVYIGPGVTIESQDLYIGDYTRINRNAFISGTDWCYIGANCWIGHFSIIDSIGTTYIGNNVGIGAHSQLWSHIKFGDTLKGCRFESKRPLRIGDDVWFVGHCIVSPIRAEDMSMALVGSVLTGDMKSNHVYAGVPASDISERLGSQFETTSVETRKEMMAEHLEEFYSQHPSFRGSIELVEAIDDSDAIQFDIVDMKYSKTLKKAEVAFMRFLLPTRAKFIPVPERDWVYKRFIRKYGDVIDT